MLVFWYAVITALMQRYCDPKFTRKKTKRILSETIQ